MRRIRCDSKILPAVELFLKSADIPAKTVHDNNFDICIFSQKDDEIINNLPSDVIIIANGDDYELLRSLDGVTSTIVTCGMSAVSTLTVSSIEDGCIVVCLQRALATLSGNVLGFQEIPVRCNRFPLDPDNLILLLALGLIFDLNITKIKLELTI